MTLQHSPAPWVFDECDFAIYSKHATVATFASDDLPTEADGRLMAAAPDMLRLLREAISSIGDKRTRARIQMRELIAKLDGEA